MTPQQTLLITPEEEGCRLDQILASRFTNVRSRSYFQKLILQNKVLLNGEPVKKRIVPNAGDEVEIFFLLTPEITLKAEAIPLDILYEDEVMLAINKPAGMVVHPAPGNWSATFVNALLYHCQSLSSKGTVRPGIVHRLDKETSGVLIAAKSEAAQTKLMESFADRQVKKKYLAICVGKPGDGTLDAPIGRHPTDRKKMTIREDGRPAITHFKTLAFDGKHSLVEVDLETGRTHQIRVHLKSRGTPVLGDALYGKREGSKRQMLHAQKLVIPHPTTGEPIEIIAPLPEDFQQIMERIQK